MKLTIENITIVFAESESGIAESIRDFFQEKLHGGQVPQDAAIVLVSDAATEDEGWQADVRALPSTTRLIPAGQTINADYSNPDVIPTRVEELNFIRIDDDLMANLWESAIIDADFYEVRNTVLVNMDSWLTSQKSDAFLLNGWREARRCLRVVRQQLSSETDEGSREQLTAMEAYLEASRKKSFRRLLGTIRHRTIVVALVAFLIWMAVTAAQILGYMQRATDEMALLGVEHNETNAFDNSVRLLDGIGNPLIDGTTRYSFFQELMEYVDISWATTPIGLNYKHELTDAQLIDDRYLQTSTSHGHQLVWDTYSGKIKEDGEIATVGLRAFRTDVDNGIVVAVTDDNKVIFGIGDSWVTNDYAYPFADDVRISIESNESSVIVYDAKNVFTFKRTADGIQPDSFITEDTMPFEDYTIHSAILTDEGKIVAVDTGDRMYLRSYTDEGETAYNMNVKPLSTCASAVREGQVIFSDEDGNLLLFEADTLESNPIGLNLPDPRVICFVNETTIAYHDGQLGTHLYDFAQHIDLGTVFTAVDGIDRLDSNGTTVMCHADGLYICQPIDSMLPVREIDESQVVARYDAKADQSDGLIRTAAIYSDHTVQLDCVDFRGDVSYVLDGGHYAGVGPAISDYWVLPEGAITYSTEPVLFDGKPTVVGIIDDGNGFVVGAEDGTFQEFVIRSNGDIAKEGAFKAPSNSAVVAVFEMKDCFYVLDEAGNYWRARLGYPTAEGDDALALSQINGKLHHGVTKELYDSVSEQTREDLGLKIMPGGDGKEWE